MVLTFIITELSLKSFLYFVAGIAVVWLFSLYWLYFQVVMAIVNRIYVLIGKTQKNEIKDFKIEDWIIFYSLSPLLWGLILLIIFSPLIILSFIYKNFDQPIEITFIYGVLCLAPKYIIRLHKFLKQGNVKMNDEQNNKEKE